MELKDWAKLFLKNEALLAGTVINVFVNIIDHVQFICNLRSKSRFPFFSFFLLPFIYSLQHICAVNTTWPARRESTYDVSSPQKQKPAETFRSRRRRKLLVQTVLLFLLLLRSRDKYIIDCTPKTSLSFYYSFIAGVCTQTFCAHLLFVTTSQ